MKRRSLSPHILKSSRQYPVISLTGPRQSGKTTLIKSLFPDHEYVLLENPVDREFALSDPRGFLNRYSKGVIIDEAQRAPELFSYIQGIVDEKPEPARFILSGSQNFLLLEAISQSLAGRVAIHHLMPFTFSELRDDPDYNFFELQDLREVGKAAAFNLNEILFSGLYPRIHDRKLDPPEWIGNYLQTYLERDVKLLANIGNLETYRRFFSLCAGRCGQILDQESLSNDCGVSNATVKRWLSILEASFQIILLRPYHKSFNKRIIKRPKLYFTDTGVMSYLLGIRSAKDIPLHPLRGALFENYVVSSLYKMRLHHRSDRGLYFWRESNKLEVDLVIEKGGDLEAYEIKASETFRPEFLAGVEKFKSIVGNNSLKRLGVIYGGVESFEFNGNRVLSWKRV